MQRFNDFASGVSDLFEWRQERKERALAEAQEKREQAAQVKQDSAQEEEAEAAQEK